MDRHDGVAGIVLFGEQRPQLGLLKVLLEPGDGGLELRLDALALGRELDQDLKLLLEGQNALEVAQVLVEELLPLLQGLGGLLVAPDLGRGQTSIDRLDLGVLGVEVKENLEPLRSWRRGR